MLTTNHQFNFKLKILDHLTKMILMNEGRIYLLRFKGKREIKDLANQNRLVYRKRYQQGGEKINRI